MPDYGARVAEKAIRDIERKIRSTYGTARRELQVKLNDFNQRYAARDKIKRQQLAEGKISKQQYADWKAGQVFMRTQWQRKIREVSQVMTNANEQAMRIVNDRRLDVFSENYNFSAFLAERQLGISFDVYNTQAVARLIQEDPQVLPEWKIDEEKDYEWNYKKVNNIIQQGIIQGEGIPEITRRLCNDLSTQNENKMRMFARTAITGAQNAGRQHQMEDAAEMGIQVEKQWIASLDAHTRQAHRDRDGETVPYNEEFSGGLEYPGDPAGDAADVYNCRCTMITVYPEHAAHHDVGERRAYNEWEDEEGNEQRESYVTDSEDVYKGWSDTAYQRWVAEKQEKNRDSKQEREKFFGVTGVKKAAEEIHSDSPNEIVHDYFEKIGYNDLPSVVNEKDFEGIESNYPTIYRGLNGENANLYRSQFLFGERHIGNGANGRGNNFSTKKYESEEYAGRGGSMIEAKLIKGAKVINDEDLIQRVIEMRKIARENGYEDELLVLMKDPGSVAAMLGYDAIYDEKLEWLNILNRSKLVIKR